jgi:hypothetical protein
MPEKCGSQLQLLNDLIPVGSGWNLKEARAINENGEIVGRGTFNSQTHAFLLIPDGGSRYLLSGPVPGVAGERNTFTSTNGTPGAKSSFVYAFQAGSTDVPGCPGLTLSLNNPQSMGSRNADANGTATLSISVPSNARGKTVLFQAYEGASCQVTNAVQHTFQ